MKYAFLGKGGSGKSTLATALVTHLHRKGATVLAIDADHNMDLLYNLGVPSLPTYLGDDPRAIFSAAGVTDRSMGFSAAAQEAARAGAAFMLTPPDGYTARFAHALEPGLYAMAAGPHTDAVRSGENCSHSLAAPLKLYVSLLALGPDEAVVLDERAGTDPVATGILKGVDIAYIVAEGTRQSVRVAGQIARELAIADVPYAFVANKFDGDSALFAQLPDAPLAYIPRSSMPDVRALSVL
jgi:CO dehydrogenase nickel-insertion accessory protein CooC1